MAEPDGPRPGRRPFLARVLGFAGLAAPVAALAGRAAAAREGIPQPGDAGPAAFMNRAAEMRDLARAAGDQGYGAVIVKQGRIVGQAPSRVVSNGDPTAHAEMEAIRDAAARLGTRDLSGCVLYSTSRACTMCETAAYWARVDRMVHGQSLTEAGAPGYRSC